ncbi:MAG: L-serine ammonia-lyase, iron-sulfur-dependent, subunit alpha [Lachnospiraceae bacterium]
MAYKSLEDICNIAKQENIPFWEVIRGDDCRERQVSPEESFAMMEQMYLAMEKADQKYRGDQKSHSGMAGGDGKLLEEYVKQGKNLSGPFIGQVMQRAVKMAESNACMRRIVAAPTAGSCGVLPAVLLSYESQYDCPRQKIIEALFVAAGIGQIIAERASIAGASGGCQAEIGSASAMAAGALTYLLGGKEPEICSAVAISLKGLLGLTCDPIGGLVEVPCVKRNVIGAVNAVTTADMVTAGIQSVIPADEVIDAMGEIGREMPKRYRETSEGGLAVTPTALKIASELREKE